MQDAVDLPGEEWRKVAGIAGYDVSNLGRVRSRHNLRPVIRRHVESKRDGYCRINLTSGPGTVVTKYVHLLVGAAWVPNPEGKPELDHGDGRKSNCRADNLEWVTHKENIRRGMARLGNWLRGTAKIRVRYRRVDSTTQEAVEYDSLRLAAASTGVANASGNIAHAARRGREAYGFHWVRLGKEKQGRRKAKEGGRSAAGKH